MITMDAVTQPRPPTEASDSFYRTSDSSRFAWAPGYGIAKAQALSSRPHLPFPLAGDPAGSSSGNKRLRQEQERQLQQLQRFEHQFGAGFADPQATPRTTDPGPSIVHSVGNENASLSASPTSSSSAASSSSRSVTPRSSKTSSAVAMSARPAKRPADGSGGATNTSNAAAAAAAAAAAPASNLHAHAHANVVAAAAAAAAAAVAGPGPDDLASCQGSGRPKLSRTDRGPEDFSTVVKNRLQSYTRTGQACDRCKVRKIRCDALPEGCSHCVNLNLECYVTDRVTGRTERRGYMQELEREKNGMLTHISDLEKLLRENGVEVKPWQGASWPQYPPDAAVDDSVVAVRDPSAAADWSQFGSLWIKKSCNQKTQFAINFPRSLWPPCPDQNHLGVGPDDAPLSSIRGTKLSLLGTTIDTTSFDAPDVDEPGDDDPNSAPLYNKSVQAFLRSCMGVNPPIQADLPARSTAFMYADWYFMTVSAFLPLLHRPSFMQVLARLYDDPDFKPSVPDHVIVHMVLATIYFQCAVRNWQDAVQRNHLNDLSNKHYHFALSKIYDLLGSNDLSAVQALALIASHTRSFPKPGCSSIVASMALYRALELNLHRSSRRPGEGTNLENEMRKRTWWVILTVVVAITGRRGNPMPLAVQDFDTDYPEPIADELLTESGVDTSRSLPCPFDPGLAGFKIVPLFMEMYCNIYSVRRDAHNYINVVNALENQLRQWEAELPDSLKVNHSEGLEHLPFAAIYTRIFALELRLCLRHPSVAAVADKDMMAENSRICEETARQFLECMEQIVRLKALDTTWYQMSVYGVCIFSMLVAQWERRFETSPEQLATLREDMNKWMNILRETSLVLGCGPGIANEIGHIIERTCGWIEHDMLRQGSVKSPPPPPPVSIKHENQLPAPYRSGPESVGVVDGTGAASGDDQPKDFFQQPNLNGQATFPTLSYEGQAQANADTSAAYQAETAMYYSATAPAATVPDNQVQPNPLADFVPQTSQHVASQAGTEVMWQAGRGNSWQDWTTAIADGQERYSASALLTLGNTGRASVASSIMTESGVGQTTAGDIGLVPPGAQWPMVIFDHPTQGG